MSLESYIISVGYLGILFGVFLEGETVLILAGGLACSGYLSLPGVILTAFLGALASDQFWFHLGRIGNGALLNRFFRGRQPVKRFRVLLTQHQTPFVFSLRFLYGLRTVAPLSVGFSGMSSRRYFWIDSLSAFMWALMYGYIGFALGQSCQTIIPELSSRKILMIFGIALVGFTLLAYYHSRKNQHHSLLHNT